LRFMQSNQNKMNIIPYMEIDGCRTISDKKMISLWEQMEKEGNREKIFFNNCFPQNGDQFLKFVKNEMNKVFMAYEDESPILITWVSEIIGKRGTISFCSFDGHFARKKLKAGREILLSLFQFFEVLVALIPESFNGSRHFTELLGFKELGVIPYFSWFSGEDKQIGTFVKYITKESLEEKNE
jgi:hypothetical protein